MCKILLLGFAVKLDLLLTHNTVTINPNSHFGWLESDFLSQLVNPHDAEGQADNCMKVCVLKGFYTYVNYGTM